MKFRWALASVIVLSLGALTGCAGETSVSTKSYSGMPEGVDVDRAAMDNGVQVGWINRDQVFYVTTWGSSSCPEVATALRVIAPDALEVEFHQPYDGPCTADYAPASHEFNLPAEITEKTISVTVRLSLGRSQTVTLE